MKALVRASCLCSCIRTRLLNFGRLGDQSRETRPRLPGRSAEVVEVVTLSRWCTALASCLSRVPGPPSWCTGQRSPGGECVFVVAGELELAIVETNTDARPTTLNFHGDILELALADDNVAAMSFAAFIRLAFAADRRITYDRIGDGVDSRRRTRSKQNARIVQRPPILGGRRFNSVPNATTMA